MNVLSLFGGIECGKVAIDRAGIKVNKYYSSEVDKHAIKVSTKNHPDIIHLGDVTKWRKWNIDWSIIDMLIGGSPCQGFSIAGKQLNFDDPRSKLFFVYAEILEHIKSINTNIVFLLENVKMKKESQNIISKYLKVEPIIINSNLLSAQDRNRSYWTNIEGITQPIDKNIMLYDVIKKERKWFQLLPWCLKEWGGKIKVDTLRTIESKKSFCLTTNKSHPKNYYLNKERNMMTKLDAEEFEVLQTIPFGYTDCVSEGHRIKQLGNGWTIDVIVHILSFINKGE